MTDKKESTSTLDKIMEQCKEYIKDESYVYKLCADYSEDDGYKDKWLIILQKTKNTNTNEKRIGVIDKAYAKFRANELLVIKIIDVENPDRTDKKQVVNRYYETKTIYEINKIVTPDYYDEDIDLICSGGIHYYNTLLRAYYYRRTPKDYTGNWIRWHNNGQKREEGVYVDGKETGLWTLWHYNGEKYEEGNYMDGRETGKWREWTNNGKLIMECNYLDGKLSGQFESWHENGKKKIEGKYSNGGRIGSWYWWDINGEKEGEKNYDEQEI